MTENTQQLALQIRTDLEQAVRDVRNFRNEIKAVGKTAQETDRASAALGTFKNILGAIGVGFSVGSILSGMRQIVQEAAEAERIEGRLNAVLKATGRDAQFTSDQLIKLGDSLAETTRFTDDEAKTAATRLLTFTNISREVFPETLRMAAGLASVLETDLSTAAQQLGRVLNDPVKNLNALSRAGITFTDAQEQMVTKMVSVGDAAGAQRLILEELARRGIGSAATGENTGLYKATNDMTKAWGDLLETIGRTPTVQAGAKATLGSITVALKAMEEQTKDGNEDFERRLGLRPARRLTPTNEITRDSIRQSMDASGLGKVTIKPEIGEEGRKAIQDMERRIGLLGKETVEQQTLFDIEKGRYAHLNSSEKEALVNAARRLDMAQKDEDAHKKVTRIIQEQIKANEEYEQSLTEEAEALRDSIDPTRELVREQGKLLELLQAGKISLDEYWAGMGIVQTKLDELAGATEEVTDDMSEFAMQAARNMQTAFADEFTNILMGNFDDLGNAFHRLLLRMTAELAAAQFLKWLTGDVAKTGQLGGALGSLFHDGGVVGSGNATRRQVSPLLFAGAPRMHSGGVAGLRSDEVPAILKRGELVIPAENIGQGGSGNVKVEVQNSGSPKEVREAQATFDPEGMIVRVITQDLQRGGPVSGSLQRTFNLKR